MKLQYTVPANIWTDALPIGNGRLGGMIFGGVQQERIQFNEDTLWSGPPVDGNNPNAKEVLRQKRLADAIPVVVVIMKNLVIKLQDSKIRFL